MSEIRFKSKKNIVTIPVEKEIETGEIQKKILSFDCSPTNFTFVKKAAAAADTVRRIMDISADVMSESEIDELMKACQCAFDAMAPGRYLEFFEYLDYDIVFMAQLINHMVSQIKTAGVSAKTESIIHTEAPTEEDV